MSVNDNLSHHFFLSRFIILESKSGKILGDFDCSLTLYLWQFCFHTGRNLFLENGLSVIANFYVAFRILCGTNIPSEGYITWDMS